METRHIPEARRLGHFSLPAELVRCWSKLLPLMSHFVVVEARYNRDSDTIDYLAYCELFEDVPAPLPAAHYHVMWSPGNRAVEVSRCR